MKKFVDFIIKNFIYLVIILIDVIGFIEIDKLLESSDYGPFKYVFSAGIYAICVIICAITFKKMANKKLKTKKQMNKKGGLGGTLLMVILIVAVIELSFCIYVMYHCYTSIDFTCNYPNFFGLGKYMIIPVKGFIPSNLNLSSQNIGNFSLR